MPIPANWESDPDNPDIYTATQTVAGVRVKYTVNARTGDFSGKKAERNSNTITGGLPTINEDLFSYNAKDDKVTYENADFKEKVQSDSIAQSTITNIVPQRINEINKELSQTEDSGITPKDREEFLKGARYRRIEDTVADETPATGDTDPEPEIVNVNDLLATPVKAKTTQENFGSLVYPNEINKIQDYIQFTIGKYKPKDLKGGENIVTLSERPQTLTEIYGTISLPIQPSIVDSNSVAWNENELNPLQVALLKEGINIAGNGVNVNRIADEIEDFLGKGGNNAKEIINYGKLFLAQKAIGAQNLQSRFGGGIVNPNMELLFTGPQLRPFNFNFRLSPRKEGEANTVRKIIKTFKLSMAPKVSSTNAFLAAPSIFQIKYLRPDDDHPSLNRIKLCALKSCVVDYTPENSYMTFKDASNTMVSYNLSLQFQELEPVYDQDYNSIKEEIGY